jgi:hypothetical protein
MPKINLEETEIFTLLDAKRILEGLSNIDATRAVAAIDSILDKVVVDDDDDDDSMFR